MRKYLLVMLISFYSILSFAQNNNESDKVMRLNSWKVGKTKSLYGHTIERVSGSGGFFSKTITNISYRSSDDLIGMTLQKANKEMWTEEEKRSKLEIYSSIGGRIDMYIMRNTIESGNTGYFTMIVKDLDGNEICREKFAESIPDYSITSGMTFWWQFGIIFIIPKVTPPFLVYIIDSISEPTQHCFKVLN